jgi:transposase-like protein
LAARRIDPERRQMVLAMLREGRHSHRAISRAAGCCPSTVTRLAGEIGVAVLRRDEGGGDPGPLLILARAARIRRSWTDAERAERRAGLTLTAGLPAALVGRCRLAARLSRRAQQTPITLGVPTGRR